MKGSWQTLWLGIGAVATGLGDALKAQFDNDPLTVANWGLVVGLILAAIGVARSRQNDVTSEESGAKAASALRAKEHRE